MKHQFFHIPENVAAKPASGPCLVNEWWAFHPEKGLAFLARNGRWEDPIPQCNRSETVARIVTEKIHSGHTVKQIPVVYLAHATAKARLIQAEKILS